MFWCGCCSPNETEDGQFLVPSEGPIDNRESIGTTDQNYENERSSATSGAWKESGPGNVGIENSIVLFDQIDDDQNKIHEIEDSPEPPNTSITGGDMEDNLITVHESFHDRVLHNDSSSMAVIQKIEEDNLNQNDTSKHDILVEVEGPSDLQKSVMSTRYDEVLHELKNVVEEHGEEIEDNLTELATENDQSNNTHETRESSNILETCEMEDNLLTENNSFCGRALETLVEVEGVEEEVSLSSDSSSSNSVKLHISVNMKDGADEHDPDLQTAATVQEIEEDEGKRDDNVSDADEEGAVVRIRSSRSAARPRGVVGSVSGWDKDLEENNRLPPNH